MDISLRDYEDQILEMMFHSLQPEPFNESLLDHYSDAVLINFCLKSALLFTTRPEPIYLLSPNLVIKRSSSSSGHLDEVNALRFAQRLGIRVPAVRRVVCHPEEEYLLIFMDRIHGDTLEQRWSEISWWSVIRVAWQLRGYLRLMRRTVSASAGGVYSGRVRSPWFGAIYGPVNHVSPPVLAGYINWWLKNCRPYRFKPLSDCVLKPQPNVLVHQDLVPRNMILDAQPLDRRLGVCGLLPAVYGG